LLAVPDNDIMSNAKPAARNREDGEAKAILLRNFGRFATLIVIDKGGTL
jgi:hypothetical protein